MLCYSIGVSDSLVGHKITRGRGVPEPADRASRASTPSLLPRVASDAPRAR